MKGQEDSDIRTKFQDINLHEIQSYILRQLGYRNEKTFSALQGNWDSSKVSFHLKRLQDLGLIEKKGNKYKVTSRGRGILADIKFNKYNAPINLLNLVVISQDGEVFLKYYSNNMDPLSNSYRTIVSRLLKNEHLEEKASELFKENFQTKPKNIRKAGVLENILKFTDNVSQHYMVYNLFIETENTNEDFYAIDDLDSLDLVPGLDEIISKIHKGENLPFMGRWDLIDEEGFELERLEFK